MAARIHIEAINDGTKQIHVIVKNRLYTVLKNGDSCNNLTIENVSDLRIEEFPIVQEMSFSDAQAICETFAAKHGLIFKAVGECGFGRDCAGLSIGDAWLNYNPVSSSGDYAPIKSLQCDDCFPPNGVDAYHKHECFAVLGTGEAPVIGLAKWIQHIESKGTPRVVEYRTGATGIQAMISGHMSKCLIIDKPESKT